MDPAISRDQVIIDQPESTMINTYQHMVSHKHIDSKFGTCNKMYIKSQLIYIILNHNQV